MLCVCAGVVVLYMSITSDQHAEVSDVKLTGRRRRDGAARQLASGLDECVLEVPPVENEIAAPPVAENATACRPELPLHTDCDFFKQLVTEQKKFVEDKCDHDQYEQGALCSLDGPTVTCRSLCGHGQAHWQVITYTADQSNADYSLESKNFSDSHSVEGFLRSAISSSTGPYSSLLLQTCLTGVKNARLTHYQFLLPTEGAGRKYSVSMNESLLTSPFRIKQPDINIVFLNGVSRLDFRYAFRKCQSAISAVTAAQKQEVVRAFTFPLFQTTSMRKHEELFALMTGFYPSFQEVTSASDHVTRSDRKETVLHLLARLGTRQLWQESACDFNASALEKLRHHMADSGGTSVDAFSTEIEASEWTAGWRFVCKLRDAAARWRLPLDTRCGIDTELATLSAIKRDSKQALFVVNYVNLFNNNTVLRGIIDGALSKHILSLKKQTNTITLVIGSHGNPLSEFYDHSSYGRSAMSNPVLTVLLSPGVRLSQVALRTAEVNSRSLVTTPDIHDSLLSLLRPELDKRTSVVRGSDPRQSYSLFASVVPASRTCDDVSIQPPNLCTCEGEGTAALNDTMGVALAELALSELNRQIELQQEDARRRWGSVPSSVYTGCQRLQGVRFETLHVRRELDSLVTSFNLYVRPGKHVTSTGIVWLQPYDIFKVMLSETLTSSMSRETKLVKFSRETDTSVYHACADAEVSVELCVCDILSTSAKERRQMLTDESLAPALINPVNFGTRSRWSAIDHRCLYLLVRNYRDTVTFEAVNVCSQKAFDVYLNVLSVNMVSSTTLPTSVRLQPIRSTFIAYVQKVSYFKHSVKLIYRTNFTEIDPL